MPDNTAQIGRLACSMQGRDSGRFYLVVGSVNETRLLLADGEVRKVENPKIKNVKHLKFYDMIAGEVFNKSISGKKINNADVRKELKSLIEQV
jgi:ribosomal protein L14E/L6E/L27E